MRGDGRIGATFRVGGRSHEGTLAFTVPGMKFLEDNGIILKPGDAVKIYHDPDNDQLALKKDKAGNFKVSRNAKSTVKLHSKDLAGLIQKNVDYALALSNEFDLLLNAARVEAAPSRERAKSKASTRASGTRTARMDAPVTQEPTLFAEA